MKPRKSESKSFVNPKMLEKLLAVGQSLTTVHDLNALLKKIARTAGSILKADIIVLYEYREETNDVVIPPVIWGDIQHVEVLKGRGVQHPHRESAVFQILQHMETFYAVDAAQDWSRLLESYTNQEKRGEFIQREKIISSAAVRLMTDHEKVGVLFVNYRESHSFNSEERKTIQLLASQAAIAIRNARLLERERRLRNQADILREVSIAISSTAKLEETAGRILDALGKVIEFRKATMQLILDDNRSLIAYRGFREKDINPWLLRPISKDPLISQVIASAKPVILSETEINSAWEINPQTKDVHSWAGIPLIFADRTVGLITMDHDRSGFYTPSIVNLLISFANQAAIAIENSRLFEKDQRRIRDLQILNDIAQIMSTKLGTQDLLKAIVAQIAEKLNCSHSAIFFPEDDHGTILLKPQVVHSDIEEVIRTRHFRIGEGLTGWVYQHNESIVLADVRNDPRFQPARQNRDKPRSMLVVPLRVADQTIGVISADQDRYGWFDQNDLRLVEALSRQAGIAIQRNRGFEILQDVGSQINSAQNLDEILQLIVSGAIELTHTTSGIIYLVEGSQLSDKRYKFPPDSYHPEPRINRKDSSTRQVIDSGEMLVFPNVHDDPRVNPELRERISSMIALPLKHNKVIGVLYLNDQSSHDFSETEITLLKSLANLAATAIYKTEILANLEHQLRSHRALNDVGVKLTGILNEDSVLQAVAQSAVTTMNCRHCSVFRIEPNGLAIRASYGSRESELTIGKTFELGQGVAGWVAQNGKPALVFDTLSDGRFDPTWSSQPPNSLVAVPIWLNQKVYGAISAEDEQKCAFNEQDQRLLETLALQVSQAIYIAKRVHDLEALNTTGHIINSQLDIEQIFHTLLDTVDNTLNCFYSTLYIVETNNELAVNARSKFKSQEVVNRRFKIGEGLVGWVAQEGCTLNVPDVRVEDRFLPLSYTIPLDQPHSVLLAPMRLQDRVLGVIVADKNIVNGFDENDRTLLETLASQAAIAYDKARLYNELLLLHDINKRLITLDLDELLPLIVEGAKRLTQTEHGIIYLLSEDGTRITKFYPLSSDHSPSRLQLNEGGVTRIIFEKGEPIAISNILEDPRVSDDVVKWGFKAFYGQPLKVENKVIGILYLNDDNIRQFTENDQRLIATLASQAASAINNAKHYQQRIKDTAAIRRIVEIVGTIGTEADSLAIILKELISVFQVVDFGAFMIINFNAQAYELHAIAENDQVISGNRIPYEIRSYRWNEDESGILNMVMQEGKPYRTGDVRNKHQLVRHQNTLSVLAIPIKTSDNRVIGILDLESDERDAFSVEDERLCQDLANIASIAIEKDRLFLTMQRLNNQIEVLHRAVKEESSDKVLTQILDGINKLLGEDTSSCISMYEEATQRFFGYQAAGPMKDYLLGVPPRSKGGTGRYVLANKKPLYLTDVGTPPPGCPTIRPESIELGVKSFAALPLKHRQEKILGLLFINIQAPFQFSEEIKRIVDLYAAQAAIAIENSHLYEDSLQREAAIKRRQNPYITGEPIYDPQRFFGRKSLIQHILDGIHNNSFIIFGERRIGKTSLLLQLKHHLSIQSTRDPAYFFLPVYASLQGIPEDIFFSFLMAKIEHDSSIPSEKLINLKTKHKYGIDDFDTDLGVMIRFLEQSYNKMARIVLLLDEMDVFAEDYQPRIRERFRSLFATWGGTHLKMVMAGVSVQRVQQARTSPWYNQFKEIELPPLDDPDARQLIIEPVRNYYSYEPEAINLLLEYSDLKPYEIQRLGYFAVNSMLSQIHSEADLVAIENQFFKATIRQEDITRAFGCVLQEDDSKFRDLWQEFDNLQREALLEIVNQGGSLNMHSTRPDGKELFARKDLYNITRMIGQQAQLTRLFTQWLRGLSS